MYSKYRLNDVKVSKSAPQRRQVTPSCVACKTRKIRCDRGTPCEACLTRNQGAKCYYVKDAYKSGKEQSQTDHEVQLKQLAASILASESTDFNAAKHLLKRRMSAAHWEQVLSHVSNISVTNGTSTISSSLSLLSLNPVATLVEVLNSLPARPLVDRMLSVYFNAGFGILPIVHRSQFQNLYDNFWINPLESSAIWIAQLFSILCISEELTATNCSGLESEEHKAQANGFREASGQALILGNFAKPQKHVIQAILLFAQTKHMANMEDMVELSSLLALVIRHAIEMKYNKESHFLPHLSFLENEMRLRCWGVLCLLDTMNALQFGVPKFIAPGERTTDLPRHIMDDDLDELTLEMPQEMSTKTATPLLYFLAKCQLSRAVDEILDEQFKEQSMNDVELNSKTIWKLDKELGLTYDSLPTCVKPKPIAQSYADHPTLIIGRIKLANLYRRSRCLLHRASLFQPDANNDARNICVEGAMSSLNHLLEVYSESRPGGQLHHAQWMFTLLGTSDTLFAAAILSLYISKIHAGTYKNSTENDLAGKISILSKTAIILAAQWPHSKEASQVTEALQILLAQVWYDEGMETMHTEPAVTVVSQTQEAQAIFSTEELSGNDGLWDATHDILDAGNFTDWSSWDEVFSLHQL